jgi:hypothetical protein
LFFHKTSLKIVNDFSYQLLIYIEKLEQNENIVERIYMKKCLHQIIRPKKSSVSPPGVGDCSSCQTDESNKSCKNYFPVSPLQTFTVEKNEGEEETTLPRSSLCVEINDHMVVNSQLLPLGDFVVNNDPLIEELRSANLENSESVSPFDCTG